ncbi:MAG: RNA methyltransferase [Ignavibacteria bacterium]|nr:RNA methyltransferase [Ignavibacteria bacterium]
MTNKELKLYSSLKLKKYRETENLFLIEGEHLVEECLKSIKYKNLLIKLLIEKGRKFSFLNKYKELTGKTETEEIETTKFRKISETKNSQGIAGILQMPEKVKFSKGKLIVALDNINDPGNLGTILRTCHWFGTDTVLISENSVDIYNSKVLRASQGSVFHIDIITDINLNKTLFDLYKDNYDIYLTTLETTYFLDDIKFEADKKTVFVFGNEATGISKDLINNKIYKQIKIKGYSTCESLNIGISTGILLHTFRNKYLIQGRL